MISLVIQRSKKKNIDNQVFALVAKLSQRLVDKLVVKSTSREEKGLNTSNVIKEKVRCKSLFYTPRFFLS